MRLCLVTPYPQTICGIADYAYFLVKGLLKVDPDLTIDVIAEPDAESDDPRVRVHRAFKRERFAPEDVLKPLRELHPRLVHVQHNFGIFGADDRMLELLDGVRELGAKVVLTMHTVYSRETAGDRFGGLDIEEYNRELCARADHVVVLTRSMKQVLARQGIDEHKISVLPIGPFDFGFVEPAEARRKLGLPLDRKLVVSAGFVHTGKGLHLVIEVCRELLNMTRDFALVLAGWLHPHEFEQQNVPYARKCLRMIEEYGLEDHVITISRTLSREELAMLISAADVVLCLYTIINWSASGMLKLAIGARKPVLVTRVPKFEEVSEQISDEIAVLPGEIERAAKVLHRLLYDERFRGYIIRRIDEYARRISWENIAREHLEIYRRLLGG